MDTFIGLSLSEIAAAGAEHGLKELNLIPFARDIDGTLLSVTTGDAEKVVSWDPDLKQVVDNTEKSYGQYLESIRDRLLSKKIVYEEELGLVEIQ